MRCRYSYGVLVLVPSIWYIYGYIALCVGNTGAVYIGIEYKYWTGLYYLYRSYSYRTEYLYIP